MCALRLRCYAPAPTNSASTHRRDLLGHPFGSQMHSTRHLVRNEQSVMTIFNLIMTGHRLPSACVRSVHKYTSTAEPRSEGCAQTKRGLANSASRPHACQTMGCATQPFRRIAVTAFRGAACRAARSRDAAAALRASFRTPPPRRGNRTTYSSVRRSAGLDHAGEDSSLWRRLHYTSTK